MNHSADNSEAHRNEVSHKYSPPSLNGQHLLGLELAESNGVKFENIEEEKERFGHQGSIRENGIKGRYYAD